MAYHNGVSNGYPQQYRHEAHDSALDVDSKVEATRMRVRELEEENHMLAERASSASQRFADYENEIRVLQTRLREQQIAAGPLTPDSEHPNPVSTPERMPTLSRFGSFMRKPSLAATTSGHSVREQELEASLAREQAARKEADKKVKQVNAEIEELSASLFQQANDMVASERRENAALKAKIQELEKGGSLADAKKQIDGLCRKIESMERRDAETKRRLDKLDAAQRRIDRVRAMLVPR